MAWHWGILLLLFLLAGKKEKSGKHSSFNPKRKDQKAEREKKREVHIWLPSTASYIDPPPSIFLLVGIFMV